ncbi:MAG: tetratricopeptide repeat protein [Treponema sp.]|nr:tetratricopeptide repeat protein [Treponema sp.]
MMFNKKIAIIIFVIFSLVLLFNSCLSSGSGADGLSLMEAIEKSAEKIASDLPSGSRVVITAFESENEGLSQYVIEELISSLISFNIEVVDRDNLEYVYQELNFQTSGYVNSESAAAIGGFLGAQFVITGNLTNTGSIYRLRINVTHMERVSRASISNFNVYNDSEMQTLIIALAEQTSAERKTSYRGNEAAPRTAGAFLDRGILFARRSDFGMAISDFTDALRLNPNLTAAYVLRGRAIFTSVSMGVSISGNFSDVRVASTMGRTSADQARLYDLAIDDFSRAIELDPFNAPAYRERGRTFAQKGDYDRAITDYDTAIRLNPNFAAAYNNRGNAYSLKRDNNRAIIDFNRAIQINPDFADAYFNRALAHAENRNYNQAIDDFEAVLRINPNDTEARQNLDILNR